MVSHDGVSGSKFVLVGVKPLWGWVVLMWSFESRGRYGPLVIPVSGAEVSRGQDGDDCRQHGRDEDGNDQVDRPRSTNTGDQRSRSLAW